MVEQSNDAAFAFLAWETPFENSTIDLIGAEFSEDATLTFRVRVRETGSIYRVSFAHVSAFRVLDEHGLLEIWKKTKEMGGRPGSTTFRIRNHLWTKESPISFLASDGWSYVAASDDYCIEAVAGNMPTIVQEA